MNAVVAASARCARLRCLYASKKVEYQASRLHMPNPCSAVKRFLYYLYTDPISPLAHCKDLTDVAGMWVVANLYVTVKRCLLCVNPLTHKSNMEHAANTQKHAGLVETVDRSVVCDSLDPLRAPKPSRPWRWLSVFVAVGRDMFRPAVSYSLRASRRSACLVCNTTTKNLVHPAAICSGC